MSRVTSAPNWPSHLQPHARFTWARHPDPLVYLIQVVTVLMFSFAAGPRVLVISLILAGLFLVFARDFHAMTDRRAVSQRHLPGGQHWLYSLPRAGTCAAQYLSRSAHALTFTAPDRSIIRFFQMSRATLAMLLDADPKGSPFPDAKVPS